MLGYCSHKLRYSSTLLPVKVPSLLISVHNTCLIPTAVYCDKICSSVTPLSSIQPWVGNCLLPCSSILISSANTIFSLPYFSIHRQTSSGCLIAKLPITTRSAPKLNKSIMSCSERIPPPTCMIILGWFIKVLMVSNCLLLLSLAPSKSTICITVAPAFA